MQRARRRNFSNPNQYVTLKSSTLRTEADVKAWLADKNQRCCGMKKGPWWWDKALNQL